MAIRSSWWQRLEIPKITPDWVKVNCSTLTNRERLMLDIIYYRKLVRRDHLEIIHPDYRNIPRRTSVINRSIKKLFQKMCIDKAHEEAQYMAGNFPAVLSVDRAGSIVINKIYKPRLEHEKRMIHNKLHIFRSLPSTYPHIHGVNQLEVDTINFCLENDLETDFLWQLEHENIKKFTYIDEITLIPDVFCIIRAKKGLFLAFIEYDTGSENHRYRESFPIIGDKLEKYQKYRVSGAWQSELWAQKINTNFPPLLFVTEDKNRIDWVRKRGRSLGVNLEVCIAKDYSKTLAEMIPL